MGMNYEWSLVRDFHKKFGHPVSDTPCLLQKERVEKRYKWMLEELNEFLDAPDMAEQADAMIDLIYFALGTMVEMGIPPEQLFEIVQQANMAKLWPDGKPHYNSDGKTIKPAGWKDPHTALEKCIETLRHPRG